MRKVEPTVRTYCSGTKEIFEWRGGSFDARWYPPESVIHFEAAAEFDRGFSLDVTEVHELVDILNQWLTLQKGTSDG